MEPGGGTDGRHRHAFPGEKAGSRKAAVARLRRLHSSSDAGTSFSGQACAAGRQSSATPLGWSVIGRSSAIGTSVGDPVSLFQFVLFSWLSERQRANNKVEGKVTLKKTIMFFFYPKNLIVTCHCEINVLFFKNKETLLIFLSYI